jgi:hypothetical protein
MFRDKAYEMTIFEGYVPFARFFIKLLKARRRAMVEFQSKHCGGSEFHRVNSDAVVRAVGESVVPAMLGRFGHSEVLTTLSTPARCLAPENAAIPYSR